MCKRGREKPETVGSTVTYSKDYSRKFARFVCPTVTSVLENLEGVYYL